MRRIDTPSDYPTAISPALAPAPWPFRPVDTGSRPVRLPLTTAGSGAFRSRLRPAAALLISIALIAVYQF